MGARQRFTVTGLKRAPCANAVVRMRRRGIDVDREDARAPSRGHSDQRRAVPIEFLFNNRLVDRRAVDPVLVERPFLADRAYRKDRNAMPRESYSGVED
jgi:hypothetical protein